jgi:pimeloyl-ACP methyl ester carboxylesterase
MTPRRVAPLICAATVAALPGVAAGREPRLTVAPSRLAAALTCYGEIAPRAKPPIIFAPGTGSDGSQVYALGKGAFDAIGRPLCVVAFPDRSTADLQVSVQYLVYAIRKSWREARRPIAVAGVSQGGLLARVALTYWPSLRSRVADVVSAAGTQHGSTKAVGGLCDQRGCPPAVWQQAAGSHFLEALNNGRDETPGKTSWTTVRSATDEVVEPQTGSAPTSSLKGAVNILIQHVCPGRTTTHIGTGVDSVTFAAFVDAIQHRGKGKKGAAKVSRFPGDVCNQPYASGLDEAKTSAFLSASGGLTGSQQAEAPKVPAEPRVRRVFRRATP